MKSADAEEWRTSAINEIMNFISQDSWQQVSKDVPRQQGKLIIGTKFVFKNKLEQDNSIRRKTRLVSKGYQQIPGVDYTESFSPVAMETSVRMAIALTLHKQEEEWNCEVIDIEAAFLESTIDTTTTLNGLKEW